MINQQFFILFDSVRSSVAAWAYLSFLRLQHHVFIQPEGSGQCGYRGRIYKSAYLGVKEVSLSSAAPLFQFNSSLTER